MRNGYLFAVAPNGSTATLAGTSEGVDPVMNRFWLEEKKGSITPKVAPGLCQENFLVLCFSLQCKSRIYS